jgi:release factor glutamine methyltransferase
MKIKPADKEEWRKDLFSIYDKIKSHTESYGIVCNGVEITVLPNVFSPKYFTDSEWFAKTVSKIVGRSSLLEVGSGTGIIALSAALRGAEVVALDINPDAVKNTKLNFEKYNISREVLLSDMFDSLDKNEKFDFIFWNHPFNNWPEKVDQVLLLAGLDYKYCALSRYISEAHKYLVTEGRLLLGTGNNADLDSIEQIAQKNGYKMKNIAEEVFSLGINNELINSYIVFELIKK